MPSFTKKIIMDSLMKLLDERPLNRITVKDIVEDCGVNRNTFYYHFQDIPTLIEAIMREEADRIMRNYEGVSSLEECLEAAMKLTMDHRRAILHIYNSVNRDICERSLMEICDHVARKFIEGASQGAAIADSDREILIQMYKCECFGHIVEWLNQGMTGDLPAQFLRLCELRSGMTEELIRRCEADANRI